MSLLAVADLVAGYGSHTVLHGVSLDVAEGESVAMLGLNGAGKSVSLKCVAGLLRPWSGTITIDGVDVTNRPAESRPKYGFAMVPQGRGILPELTVEQNLRLGGYHLASKAYRSRRAEVLSRYPILGERAQQRAGTMSGGEQAMLGVARALIARPRLLVLDEPTAGLAPTAIATLLTLLREVHASGVTLLTVEQNVGFALALAGRALLMQKGQVIRETSPDRIADRTELLAALGAGELGH